MGTAPEPERSQTSLQAGVICQVRLDLERERVPPPAKRVELGQQTLQACQGWGNRSQGKVSEAKAEGERPEKNLGAMVIAKRPIGFPAK